MTDESKSEFLRRFRNSENLLVECQKFSSAIKERADKSSSGSKLLDFKSYEEVCRLTDSLLDLCKVVMEEDDESVERLRLERRLIEKRRPIKTDSKSNATFPLSVIEEENSLRARPECFIMDSEDDNNNEDPDTRMFGTSDDESEAEAQKLAGTSDESEIEDDDSIPDARNIKSKKLIKNLVGSNKISSIFAANGNEKHDHKRVNYIKELRNMRNDNSPIEVHDFENVFDDHFEHRRKEKEKYEEDFFIRLPENKRQRHNNQRKMERSGMDSLLSFGRHHRGKADIDSDDDDDGNNNSNDNAGGDYRGKKALRRANRKRKSDGERGDAPHAKTRKPFFAKKKGGNKRKKIRVK